MFGRRQANLLLSAVFGSTLVAPGRRASVDIRLSNRFFWPTTRGDLRRVHGGVPSASLLSFSFLSEHFYASRFGHAYRGISLYLEIVRIVAACLHKSSLLKYDIPWI